MILPPTFQFSQSSLQDYQTCPRRFELRYLQQLRWPAVEAEPVIEAERQAQLGQDFHRLVHQHCVGIDENLLTASLDPTQTELHSWWQNYLTYRPELAGARLYPELALSVPLRGYRLTARFDLLAVPAGGTFLIIDWKTGRYRPPREALAGHIQSRVYPYVLAKAGSAFNHGQPIKPAAIQMQYWYARFPEQPETIPYNARLLKRDETFLGDLIEQVKRSDQQGQFPRVDDHKPCRTCIYRSHCDREVPVGQSPELLEEASPAVDVLALEWDQIAEIQF